MLVFVLVDLGLALIFLMTDALACGLLCINAVCQNACCTANHRR
jgi:hypothetical protein